MPAGPAAHALRESALWVLGALALIMLAALFTYDPRDPGFSHTGDGCPLRNQIGAGGAWFADIAYSLFGGPAYLLPLMMGLVGWLVFSMRRVPGPLDRAILGTRLAGFLLTLVTSCGLATLHFPPGILPQSAGGALGELVGSGLAAALGTVGATLLLLAFWLAAVSAFTGPVLAVMVMDTIGRACTRRHRSAAHYRAGPARPLADEAGAGATPGSGACRAQEGDAQGAAAHRAGGDGARARRACREGAPGAACLRPAGAGRVAAPVAAR